MEAIANKTYHIDVEETTHFTARIYEIMSIAVFLHIPIVKDSGVLTYETTPEKSMEFIAKLRENKIFVMARRS